MWIHMPPHVSSGAYCTHIDELPSFSAWVYWRHILQYIFMDLKAKDLDLLT
jgi:hypothetical protein